MHMCVCGRDMHTFHFVLLYSSIDPIKATSKSDEYGTSHKPNSVQNVQVLTVQVTDLTATKVDTGIL
jgi:hypothetical protein